MPVGALRAAESGHLAAFFSVALGVPPIVAMIFIVAAEALASTGGGAAAGGDRPRRTARARALAALRADQPDRGATWAGPLPAGTAAARLGNGDPRPPELACCLGGGHLAEVVDGADALRRAARERLRSGAHAIKIMASGGGISPSDPLRVPQYSPEAGCSSLFAPAPPREEYWPGRPPGRSRRCPAHGLIG
ncbi:MAG TPA: hypothetical protein VGD83_33310, partial [Streptosporangiaceae bacterium]